VEVFFETYTQLLSLCQWSFWRFVAAASQNLSPVLNKCTSPLLYFISMPTFARMIFWNMHYIKAQLPVHVSNDKLLFLHLHKEKIRYVQFFFDQARSLGFEIVKVLGPSVESPKLPSKTRLFMWKRLLPSLLWRVIKEQKLQNETSASHCSGVGFRYPEVLVISGRYALLTSSTSSDNVLYIVFFALPGFSSILIHWPAEMITSSGIILSNTIIRIYFGYQPAFNLGRIDKLAFDSENPRQHMIN